MLTPEHEKRRRLAVAIYDAQFRMQKAETTQDHQTFARVLSDLQDRLFVLLDRGESRTLSSYEETQCAKTLHQQSQHTKQGRAYAKPALQRQEMLESAILTAGVCYITGAEVDVISADA